MRSKALLQYFIVFCSVLFITSCNLQTGDWVAPNDRGRLSYSCLSSLDEDVRAFIKGDFTAEQVSATMNCVRRALDEFDHIGRGSSDRGFIAHELTDFLNTKFLGDSKITPEFKKELMNIKVVVFGGDQNFVTNTEFKKLIELTHFVEEEARRNAPYMKIYRNLLSDEEREELQIQKLTAAQAQLTRTAYNLADLLRSPKGTYKLSSLSNLIEQSRLFLNWEEEGDKVISMDIINENIEVYKMFSVGSHTEGGEETLIPEDWVPFLGTFAEWYGLYLDYTYKIKGKAITHGEGLRNFIQAADESMNLIVSAISNQNKNRNQSVIHFSLVNRILALFQRMDIIPARLRLVESVQPSFKYFVEKVMRELSIPLDEAESSGIAISHVRELKKEFYTWADGQLYIDRLYQLAKRNSLTDLGIFRSRVDTGSDSLSAGEREMKDLISRTEHFYQGEDSRVWVTTPDLSDKHGIKAQHNFHGLTRLNVLKVFARLFIRGFSKDPRRAEGMIGITQDEAEAFYKTANNLGQDLEYMDRRRADSGSTFFIEANLFTFSSNGLPQQEEGSDGHLLSFQETIEQLALVYSGSKVRGTIYESILKECSGNTSGPLPKDIAFNKTMILKACVLNRLSSVDYKQFSNLPGTMEYLTELGRSGRYEFFKTVLDLAQPACTDGQMVEYGQLAIVTTLMHYIDVIYKRYDQDQDGILNEWEVMSSYTHFRGFIRPIVADRLNKKLHKLSEKRSKSVFAYLIKYGKEPKANIGSWLHLRGWERDYFNKDPHQFDEGRNCKLLGYRFHGCMLPKMRIKRNDILQVLGKLVQGTTEQELCEGDPMAVFEEELTEMIQSLPSQPAHD